MNPHECIKQNWGVCPITVEAAEAGMSPRATVRAADNAAIATHVSPQCPEGGPMLSRRSREPRYVCGMYGANGLVAAGVQTVIEGRRHSAWGRVRVVTSKLLRSLTSGV